MNSVFGDLNFKDLIHGLYMAVLGAVLGLIAPTLQNIIDCFTNTPTAGCDKLFVFNFTTIWHLALVAALSYIFKKLTSNSKDRILTKES